MKNLLVIFAALAVILVASQPGVARAQGVGIPHYKITWEATDFITVTLRNLPAGWTRKILAIGPAKWTVTYRTKKPGCENDNDTCYTKTNHENWESSPLTDNCFVQHANCTPLSINDQAHTKWLWATGGCLVPGDVQKPCYATGINAYNPLFEVKPISESALYQNNSARGEGPALFWEDRHSNGNEGDLAVWAQGAYSYAQGGINDQPGQQRAGINVIGTMIPLRWSVEGFND